MAFGFVKKLIVSPENIEQKEAQEIKIQTMNRIILSISSYLGQ